mmetsp:Transcript_32770/g.84645  ORF Transcript_32770/g.84645 Transcript_32770/m.84645 type:complete len:133 (-) Transcript_32770:135-533(-)
MGNAEGHHHPKNVPASTIEEEKTELRCALILLKRRKNLSEEEQKAGEAIVARLRVLEQTDSITKDSVEQHTDEQKEKMRDAAGLAHKDQLPEVAQEHMSTGRAEARKFLRHLNRQDSLVHHQTLQEVLGKKK